MDEIERRVRAARPVSGHRNLPLSDRAKRELADVLLTGTPRQPLRKRRRPRRRAFLLAAMATIAAVIVGGVGLTSLLGSQHVYAATPALLKVSAMHQTAQDLLTTLGDQLIAKQDRPQRNGFTIKVQAWTLQVNDDGKATSTVIVPEEYAIAVSRDGSRRQRVTSAGPQNSDGSSASSDAGPPPGHLLWEESWKPGDYKPLFADPAPLDAAKYEKYFGAVIGTGNLPNAAAAAIQEVTDLLLEQKLSSRQEGALLQYLAGLPDLKTAGEVTDRLGRDGIAFTAKNPDRPEYESQIIVSPESGRILATETIYTGHTRTDIASPSVVGYYAWK